MSIRLEAAAAEELLDAVVFYDRQTPGLGAELLASIDQVSDLVMRFPEMGSPAAKGTRSVVLEPFPISLVYMLKDGEAIGIALAHHRREPGYWTDRI